LSSSSSPRRCPPPPSGATGGFLVHAAAIEGKRLPTQWESDYRVKKTTALLPGLFFSAIQKQIVGGSAIALLWLLSSDLRAAQSGAPSKPQPTTWNGRSGIWRHNYTVWMACPTAKTTRIKLTRPSPRLVYHCNDAISRIQEGPRPWCTQARSLSAWNGEDSSRPASAVYHSKRAGEFCL